MIEPTWHRLNQRHLVAAIGELRLRLERADPSEAIEEQQRIRDEMATPPAVETLCSAFGLSRFERAILLCAAGVELDTAFATACAAAQADGGQPYPTFGVALAALPDPHWSAITPNSPLRRWRLVELAAGGPLVSSAIRIDERVLHFLVGVDQVDERLAATWQRVPIGAAAASSHEELAEQIATALLDARARKATIQLFGADAGTCREVAGAACAALALGLFAVAARTVPPAPAELELVARLWDREALLSGSALLIEHDLADSADAGWAADRLAEAMSVSVLVSARDRRSGIGGRVMTFAASRPTMAEQVGLWTSVLTGAGVTPNGQVEELVSQFDLTAEGIRVAGSLALNPGHANLQLGEGAPAGDELGRSLWDACRHQARPALDDLAQRLEPAADWDRLILPEAQLSTLRDIAAHVRQRATVYERWGFAGRSNRGLGISALFAGPSGTGKTMAAEVLARDLRLDLYRIDLSQVVSKYIGETEKNLRRLFDAAEQGGAVLLFDEADALFGKRTEVKDSHDRFANIEVSYLLQRMEAYRGLAILTTNFKNALDPAFLRRIRFVVHFPFPDAEHREAIWRTIFPRQAPTEGLRPEWLARLDVAGGNIRNIALNAAFLAADAGAPVGMTHLLRAARSEYQKLERTLTETETAGWEE